MSYSFRPGARSVEAEIRRVAKHQIGNALKELGAATPPDEKAVHQLRKRCKKLRALIRVAGRDMPAQAKENAAFRDAARALSARREADVMIATVDALGAEAEDEATAKRLAALRDALAAEVGRTAGGQGVDVAVVAAHLRAAGERAKKWSAGAKAETFPRGIRRIYRRGRDAMARARAHPDAAHLHDWRKEVKYHWYHLMLLKRTAPGLLKGQRRLAKALSEVVGDHHDRVVLEAHLRDAALFDDPSDRDAMIALLKRKEDALVAEAFRLGRLLYAEKPKALQRRLRAYWRAARRAAADG